LGFREALRDLREVLGRLESLEGEVIRASRILAEALRGGHKVLVCGNGGSATDSQHFAAELVGRLKGDRAPLPVIALTSDTAVLTAISNDYGYSEVFSRQVEALGEEGDVLVAISTSGRSENVNRAVDVALRKGLRVIYLTGEGGDVRGDVVLNVPSRSTQRIQEIHRLLLHVIAESVEGLLLKDLGPQGDVVVGT